MSSRRKACPDLAAAVLLASRTSARNAARAYPQVGAHRIRCEMARQKIKPRRQGDYTDRELAEMAGLIVEKVRLSEAASLSPRSRGIRKPDIPMDAYAATDAARYRAVMRRKQ